jgi:hypothetical protein
MATDIMGVCARRIFIPSGIKPRLNKHYGSLNRNTGSLKPDKWLSGYWTGGSERSVYASKRHPFTLRKTDGTINIYVYMVDKSGKNG